MKRKIIHIACGGKAIFASHQHSFSPKQIRNAQKATWLMIEVVKKGYELLATFGKSPQMGKLFIPMEKASLGYPPGDSSA